MKILHASSWLPLLVTLGVIGQHTSSALASGFALSEQSVPALGNAVAGSAAATNDASTIFSNPAGLTRLSGNSVINNIFVIFPSAKFKNQGSVTVTGAPLLGGDGGDGGVTVLIPNFFAALSLSDRLKLGLGVNAPFGLATFYDRDWVGRYQSVESRLATININPTVAVKITDTFSAGAGLDVQYAAAVLSNAIDFGTIGRAAGLRTLPQTADGFLKITGDDWSVGYNLGLLYEPTQTTRLGLAYRSKVTHKLEGDADFTVPAAVAPLSRTGRFRDTGAAAELKLPDSLSFGVYHDLSPRVAIMGDVTWTNWSRLQELRVDYDNPVQPPTIQRENWEDTIRVGVGVNYAATDSLLLRAGFAFDQSPVKDEFRTARIPDGDRYWLSVGASYHPSKHLSLAVSYAHLFVGTVSITEGNATTGLLSGEFDNHVDIVGAQVTWNF